MTDAAASQAIDAITKGYAFDVPFAELGALMVDGNPVPDAKVRIPLGMLNRHGLVAGATGTGKTKTLQLLAEQISAAGIPVSLDINLRLETARQNDRCLRRALECATYVLGSGEEELAPLAGLSDPLAAAASFVRPGRAVVCRLGARGAAALDSTGTSFCPAFPVPVADTLGAGDAYSSGFLYALYNGMPLAAANRRGCAAAALNLTQPGARNCPTAAALEAFLAQQS